MRVWPAGLNPHSKIITIKSNEIQNKMRTQYLKHVSPVERFLWFHLPATRGFALAAFVRVPCEVVGHADGGGGLRGGLGAAKFFS